MDFTSRRIDDLIRLIASGANLEFPGRTLATDDLIRLAGTAAQFGRRLTLSDMAGRATDDLIRIVATGNGAVTLR